jgi:succinate dehydrogenase hydrophobic anchor subunit
MSEREHGLFKESWNMLLTYVTAMVLMFVLTFHLLLESPLTGSLLDSTLSFNIATGNLAYFKLVFGILLFAAFLHGLSGVRAIALEWFHPTRRAWLLNLVIAVLMAFFLAVGSYTLVAVA